MPARAILAGMRRIAALACLAALPAAADAATGNSFYARYIAAPCYARTYDAKHLAAHPTQRVTRFYVTDSGYDNPSTPTAFNAAFGFMLKGSGDIFESDANCDEIRGGVHCQVEGDSGTFTLEASGDGLRLALGDHLTLEGNESFSPDLAVGGDDSVFLLYRSPPEACSFE